MVQIQISAYSTFYDVATDTQFHPVLDSQTGQYVGVATVDAAAADRFRDRPAFRVLDDGAVAMLTGAKLPVVTDDPLMEAAALQDESPLAGGPIAPSSEAPSAPNSGGTRTGGV